MVIRYRILIRDKVFSKSCRYYTWDRIGWDGMGWLLMVYVAKARMTNFAKEEDCSPPALNTEYQQTKR